MSACLKMYETFGGAAMPVDDLGLHQAIELGVQLGVRQAGGRGEQRRPELAADRGSRLHDDVVAAEPIEACHQQVLQRLGNGHRRPVVGECRRCGRESVPHSCLTEASRLHERLGQLLDEERHAVGALDDALDERRRQLFHAGAAPDHLADLRPRQVIEGDLRDAPAGPGRRELGTEGEDAA